MLTSAHSGAENKTNKGRDAAQQVSCKLFAGCVASFTEGKHYILDLGPPTGGTVSFFSQFSSCLTCWDISEQLGNTGFSSIQDESDTSFARLASLFDIPAKHAFDLVLSWELFNYIDVPALEQLVPLLAAMIRKGGVIHGISSAGKILPPVPSAYEILSASSLYRQSVSEQGLLSGQLYQNRIQKIFSGFRLNRTILLRNGLYEYVLVRE